MEPNLMTLKVLLPFRIFAEIKDVTRMVLETPEGSYGILPQRRDCVATLVPGIFIYETHDGEIHYIAVDEGIMIKAESLVLVSVRNAIGSTDLGELRQAVEKEMKTEDEYEENIRKLAAKMEDEFISAIDKLRKG